MTLNGNRRIKNGGLGIGELRIRGLRIGMGNSLRTSLVLGY
jgi:hypothetical protein